MGKDETSFVKLLKRRDEYAFNLLVKKYKDQVYSLAFSMLRNAEEAKDLSQEVFISVFKSIDQFREESSLQTWIFRIATNHCINLIRYKKRRFYQQHDQLEEGKQELKVKDYVSNSNKVNPEEEIMNLELEKIINLALDELPVDQKLLIVLREVECMDYQQIAEIMNIPEGTVKSRLHRVRLALKDEIDKFYKGIRKI